MEAAQLVPQRPLYRTKAVHYPNYILVQSIIMLSLRPRLPLDLVPSVVDSALENAVAAQILCPDDMAEILHFPNLCDFHDLYIAFFHHPCASYECSMV